MANRTQALVLGFLGLMWVSLIVILALAPDVYAEALRRSPGGRRAAALALLTGIAGLIALIGVGVLRRWRWTFWLLVVAFLCGLLRLPVSVLELQGVLPASGPTWYVVLQALLGLVQFAIGLLMLAGYRRAGIWGAF